VLRVLLDAGAEVNPVDRWGGTPLADAVREGHSKVAKLLFGKGAVLGFDDIKSSSELCDFTRKGDLEHATMLLECGCPVNAADYDKRTALHLACSEGNLKMVNELFHYGVNIDTIDRWGGTPLADAVREGHTVIARALVSRGATFSYDDNKTAGELCELACNGDIERVKLLIHGKCNPSAVDYDHRSCLHLAASSGNMHVLRVLLDAGAEVNPVDRWGGTPLADAVRHGHRQCAMELYKAGARLGFDESKASGELCELARTGDIEGIRLLIDCGVDVAAADYDQRTVVHLAASMGHKHIVDFLAMKKCMDLAVKDRWGGTALDDAVREGHNKLEEALRSYYRVGGNSADEARIETRLVNSDIRERVSTAGESERAGNGPEAPKPDEQDLTRLTTASSKHDDQMEEGEQSGDELKGEQARPDVVITPPAPAPAAVEL